MKELFTELRPKDYITIGLVFLVMIVILNLQYFINEMLPKINPDDYSIELEATIKSYEAIHQKLETLEGSKLRKVGYKVDVKYKYPESNKIDKSLIVKYNSYKVNKTVIDNIITNKEGILPIKIDQNNPNKVILNYMNFQ